MNVKMPFQSTKSFFHSAERDAIIAAGGAALGTALIPFTPQLPLGKYSYVSNAIYGAALMIVGMHIKADGVGYFLIGMGVIYLVDGVIRIVMPKFRTVPMATYTQIKSSAKNQYGAMTTVNV